MAEPIAEPTLTDVMTAIAALSARMERRFEAVEHRFEETDRKIDAIAADVAGLKTGQAVLNARLDEQRSVLAALIPTRLAAVPTAA
jgi:hypothetical protein